MGRMKEGSSGCSGGSRAGSYLLCHHCGQPLASDEELILTFLPWRSIDSLLSNDWSSNPISMDIGTPWCLFVHHAPTCRVIGATLDSFILPWTDTPGFVCWSRRSSPLLLPNPILCIRNAHERFSACAIPPEKREVFSKFSGSWPPLL